jgi:cysteine synthase A
MGETMAYFTNVTQLIGDTGLLRLSKLVDNDSADVLVKLESRNPGGSVKDRIGVAMIEAAERDGLLKASGTIIEPTSGNTGIGLAMVAATKGYRCILTMPDTMSVERRNLLTTLGADLVLTPGAEGMKGALAKAVQINEQTENSFIPQQFENPANPEAHRKTTAEEIWAATDGNIDAFVCGVGTGGTVTGVGEVIKSRKDGFQVIAVEPEESPVISGGTHSPHKIQGIGAGFIPGNLNVDILDSVEQVNSDDAIAMRSRLFQEEGVFAGISSGASVAAAFRVAKRLGKGKTVVTIIHDTGERYLSMNL